MKTKIPKTAELMLVATILASIFVITLTDVSPGTLQREIVFAFEKSYILNVDSPDKYGSLAKGPAVVTKE